MYLDKPKSPSFTQSTEDTRTFLAAMSLCVTANISLKAQSETNSLVQNAMHMNYMCAA